MNAQEWLARCTLLLEQRREQSQLRSLPIVEPIDSVNLKIDGRTFVNFSGNDYLGLSRHPRMLAAIAKISATGAAASGLITGHTQLHQHAESAIAAWKQYESALLFPSGYQANVAAIQTLAALGSTQRGGVRFIVDKLAHASLIDALKISETPFRVMPHNNLAKLARLLEEADPSELQVVVTESIFSMDGDAADLRGLAELKRNRPFVLVVDEAHGSGVYGENGSGFAAEIGLREIVDISIVTLSKAIGCSGGAICSPHAFREAIVNFGRAYIYTTNVAPFVAAGAIEAIRIMHDEPHRQSRVRKLAKFVRDDFQKSGLQILSGDSPIIPVLFGHEDRAIEAAKKLHEEGLWVMPIRPPTVPAGGSRLRITISSEHTDEQVQRLIQVTKQVSH